MIWLPFLVWLGACGVAGLWFLFRAVAIRWRTDQAGWRMALFAAGFGLCGIAFLPPESGTVFAAIARAIGATAELFVGLSALRAARR